MTRKSSKIDRLSSLPDDILCHILSCLLTIDSVGTCVLSSRFKDLWRHTMKLSFDDRLPLFNCKSVSSDKYPTYMMFANIVDAVLRLHGTHRLESFHLRYHAICLPYHVSAWIQNVIMRGVQTIDLLSENGTYSVILPGCLFTSKRLEVLCLQGSISLGVVGTICLPNLRRLKLVHIDHGYDETISEIISSCVSLESLDLEIELISSDNFKISSCTLRDLRVKLSNNRTITMAINAPALQYLRLYCRHWVEYQIENAPSLEEAVIQICYVLDINLGYFYDALANIFHALENVRSLTIYENTTSQFIVPDYVFPMFRRLTVLNLESKFCGFRMMQEFILKSTKLEQLQLIIQDFHPSEDHEDCWTNPSIIPVSSLACLRSVSIIGYKDLKDEKEMVKYILENARILQAMKIKLFCNLSNQRRSKLHNNLLKFRQGSENCELTII